MYRLISQSLLPPLAPRFGHLDVVFVSSVIRVGFPRVRKIKIPVNQRMHAFNYKKKDNVAVAFQTKLANQAH